MRFTKELRWQEHHHRPSSSLRGAESSFLRITAAFCLAFVLCACRQSPSEPVTVSFLDPEWSHDASNRRLVSEEALQEFTQETGIRVNHLPAPESAPDQLALTRQLLEKGPGSADVYGIDVIWPGILAKYLVDLKPYFAAETAVDDPEMLANYTVEGKLVAVPYHTNIATLSYRIDLLKEYGFTEPPATWEEMEKMAARIQAGERAKGQKDFWGYVWPGAASEGLTCNALEWQYSEGGGRIISANQTITVDNANTIRAWERAARWIGRISSPNVLSYQEWDAINAFKFSAKAAFFRGWSSDYFISRPVPENVSFRYGVTSMPAGSAARVGVLGGLGLSVSRSSAHPEDAIRLVRFLINRENQLEAQRTRSGPPPYPELFDLPPILKAYARFGERAGGMKGGVLPRPSTVTGEKYEKVSQVYYRAVSSVLAGKKRAPEAATELAKEIGEITGFPAGPEEESQASLKQGITGSAH